jgi:hypothetical protein
LLENLTILRVLYKVLHVYINWFQGLLEQRCWAENPIFISEKWNEYLNLVETQTFLKFSHTNHEYRLKLRNIAKQNTSEP